MYDILIVDDDMLLRNQLAIYIYELRDKYRLCGEASSGEEAIAMIDRLMPDIVITDMKMSVKTGLDVIEYVVKQRRPMAVLMLSNYDDYEYVRAALRFGISDYLLKHQLSRETMESALKLAVEQLQKVRTDKAETKGQEGREDILGEQFIIELISGMRQNKEMLMRTAAALKFPIVHTTLVPVLFQVRNRRYERERNLRDQQILEFSICNIMSELLQDGRRGRAVALNEQDFCILFTFPEEHSQKKIQEIVQNTILLIRHYLKKYLNAEMRYIVGECCTDYRKLPALYGKMEKAAQNRVCYDEDNGQIRLQADSAPKSLKKGLDYGAIRAISHALGTGDMEGVERQIREVFHFIREEKLDASSSQNIMVELWNVLLLACKTKGLVLHEIADTVFVPQDFTRSLMPLPQAEQKILKVYLQVAERLEQERQNTMSKYVKQTLAIIGRDYEKPLSINQIAEEIGISHAYLSTIFKQEMKIGFPEYVNEFRVEKAKQLFSARPSIPIKEAAMRSGFATYEYFFKVFKRQTGQTPKEYLENGERIKEENADEGQ